MPWMDVSIFIRAYNEEALLPTCLAAIREQQTKRSVEVVLLDCSSTDRTVEIAHRFDAKVFSIPQRLFTYSGALNAGIKLTTGNYFVALSAHAVPTDPHWLDNLIAPLATMPSVAASFSRQIPWPNVCKLEREAMGKEFGLSAWQRDKANFTQLLQTGREPYGLLTFSNASSCIRREFLESHPFYDLPFCEDRALALDILSSGQSFAYAPESIVQHSHDPSFRGNCSIAERAMVARAAINEEAARRFNSPGHQKFLPTAKALQKKLLLLPGYIVWQSLLGIRDKAEEYPIRRIRHLAAAPGITLGKLRALKDIVNFPPTKLKRCNPEEILLQARAVPKP